MVKFEDSGDVVFDFGGENLYYANELIDAVVAIGWIHHDTKITPEHIEGTVVRLPIHKLPIKNQEMLRELIVDFAVDYKLPILHSVK
jgi:hypothetical protein